MTEAKKSSKASGRPGDGGENNREVIELAEALRVMELLLERRASESNAGLPHDWAQRITWPDSSVSLPERATAILAEVSALMTSVGAPCFDQRLWCFQCGTRECGHSELPDRRHTFDGYAATGKPNWIPFLELCLRLRPEGMDRLFREPAGVLALVCNAAELGERRLESFVQRDGGWDVVGQVIIGLISADLSLGGSSEKIVLTLQLQRQTRVGAVSHRLAVFGKTWEEILQLAADGHNRHPAEKLRRVINRSRRRLERWSINPESNDRKRDMSFLRGLRSDLVRIFAPQQNRTQHAQQRHRSGERPTGHAITDARQASLERVLYDIRRETFVVLGRRGRAHVFTHGGRHVTSLRLEDGEVSRKKKRRRWRDTTPEEFGNLKRAVTDAKNLGRRS